jgi:hypothetical protein
LPRSLIAMRARPPRWSVTGHRPGHSRSGSASETSLRQRDRAPGWRPGTRGPRAWDPSPTWCIADGRPRWAPVAAVEIAFRGEVLGSALLDRTTTGLSSTCSPAPVPPLSRQPPLGAGEPLLTLGGVDAALPVRVFVTGDVAVLRSATRQAGRSRRGISPDCSAAHRRGGSHRWQRRCWLQLLRAVIGSDRR